VATEQLYSNNNMGNNGVTIRGCSRSLLTKGQLRATTGQLAQTTQLPSCSVGFLSFIVRQWRLFQQQQALRVAHGLSSKQQNGGRQQLNNGSNETGATAGRGGAQHRANVGTATKAAVGQRAGTAGSRSGTTYRTYAAIGTSAPAAGATNLRSRPMQRRLRLRPPLYRRTFASGADTTKWGTDQASPLDSWRLFR
jgi:hypothetical protein